MATQKKIAKSSKKKKSPKKKSSVPHELATAPAAIPTAPTESRRSSVGPLLWLLGIVVVAGLGSYVWECNHSSCSSAVPEKVAAGAEIQPTPAPVTPALEPTPEKRASSPDSPRVWNRESSKGPVRFYILRDAQGNAEVTVFKQGNVLVRDIQAEAGSKGTVKLTWDGTDKDGQEVPNGTYYVRLTGAHGDMVEEILVK